jgi:Zn ribbon nucleic-acid-binding protein
MEDIITNFEFKNARLIRVCPTCAHIQDKPYDLHNEQAVLAEPCPKCGYHFPVMAATPESSAVFKDAPPFLEKLAS